MYLSTDETEEMLQSGARIAARYITGDPGCLTLRHASRTSDETNETNLRMDPWSPEGFRIEEWLEGGAIVVCAAKQLVILDERSLQLRAAVPLEYGECETGELPSFVSAEGALLITTETRVFCIDKRLAIRWCWTVKVYSDQWWQLTSPPRVEGTKIFLQLRSPRRDVDLAISMVDASGA